MSVLSTIPILRLGGATQFELQTGPKPTRFRGPFLHHEFVQPRTSRGKSDIDSPDPGFTPAQYDRLALQYIIASLRTGGLDDSRIHCVLDLHVGDHDDPQHFDLAAWCQALETTLREVRGHG